MSKNLTTIFCGLKTETAPFGTEPNVKPQKPHRKETTGFGFEVLETAIAVFGSVWP